MSGIFFLIELLQEVRERIWILTLLVKEIKQYHLATRLMVLQWN